MQLVKYNKTLSGRLLKFAKICARINLVLLLVSFILVGIIVFGNVPNNIKFMMALSAGLVVMTMVKDFRSHMRFFKVPTRNMFRTKNRKLKLKETHYIIDDSLSQEFTEQLHFAVKTLPRIEDLSFFPGTKIYIHVTPLLRKQVLEYMVSIDPEFKKFTTQNTRIEVFIGILNRSTVVSKNIPPNPHSDSEGDGVVLLTYLNMVGGGTATFKQKHKRKWFPYNDPFSFDVTEIPTNPHWEIVERFDCKANRTIIYPQNELHCGFYDLKAWPEDVPERLTLNIFADND